MSMTYDELFNILNTHFNENEIDIVDLAGDNDHWSVKIVSNKFEGMTKVKQHKFVYSLFEGKVGNELHALQLKTEIK